MTLLRPLQSSEPLIRWNYISDQWDDIESKLIDHIELTLHRAPNFVARITASASCSLSSHSVGRE